MDTNLQDLLKKLNLDKIRNDLNKETKNISIAGHKLDQKFVISFVVILILFLLKVIKMSTALIFFVISFILFQLKVHVETFESVINDGDIMATIGFGCMLAHMTEEDREKIYSLLSPEYVQDVQELTRTLENGPVDNMITLDEAIDLLMDEENNEYDQDTMIGLGFACLLTLANKQEKKVIMNKIAPNVRSHVNKISLFLHK